jgi:hypothetical protein
MIVTIPANEIYYTVRIYFRKEIMPNLPNDDSIWREEFHRWLASQGARIKPDDEHSLVTDVLGVSPGYDTIEFEDERLASLFVLKWS